MNIPGSARGVCLAILAVLAVGSAPARAEYIHEKGDFKITLSGRVVLEVGHTSNPTSPEAANGFTLYAAPQPPLDRDTASVSGRQTGLTLVVEPGSLGSFDVKAAIDMNLMGSDPGAGSAGAYFQAAFVEFQNEKWRFAFGRFAAVVAPLRPFTANWPGVDAGGDLNSQAPRDQLRVERHFATERRVVKLQGAITNPEQNFLVPRPDRVTGGAGVPNVEGRLFFGYGEESEAGDRLVEVGVSGMAGRLRGEEPDLRIEDDSWAASFDGALNWGHFGVQGEVWRGRGVGSYGGGISQSASEASDRLLFSHGYWAQVWVRPAERWRMSFVYGIDDPEDAQLDETQRSRNLVYVGNVFFEPIPVLTFIWESRRYQTAHVAPTPDGDVWVHEILIRYDW